MKFTILKKNFKQNLSVVGNAINTRSPLPILNNILIKTEGGRIKLTASDLQVTISTYVGAKIDKEGSITVPSKLLIDFINQVADEKVFGELNENTLKLKTDKVDANFLGISASEFPEVNDVKTGSVKINIDGNLFSNAVHKVYFASATDEGRPVLTGVYIKAVKDTLVVASTDGFRMAEYRVKLSEPVKVDFSCIVPARSFSTVLKSFLTQETSNVELYFNDSKNVLSIVVDDMEATFKTIEGEYPDYQSVVPNNFTTTILIDKVEFTNAIKLASVFARDTGYSVKFNIKDKEVTLSSQPTEFGSNVVQMEAKVKGEEIVIGFNAKYLLDFVTNSDATDLELKVTDPLKPGMITEKGEKEYWYIVMPMKTSW